MVNRFSHNKNTMIQVMRKSMQLRSNIASTQNSVCLGKTLKEKRKVVALVLFESFVIFKITVFRAEDDCKDGALVTQKNKMR